MASRIGHTGWPSSMYYFSSAMAVVNQFTISALVGMRPLETTLPLITSPGVRRIGYLMISAMLVTFSNVASTSSSIAASFARASLSCS